MPTTGTFKGVKHTEAGADFTQLGSVAAFQSSCNLFAAYKRNSCRLTNGGLVKKTLSSLVCRAVALLQLPSSSLSVDIIVVMVRPPLTSNNPLYMFVPAVASGNAHYCRIPENL